MGVPIGTNMPKSPVRNIPKTKAVPVPTTKKEQAPPPKPPPPEKPSKKAVDKPKDEILTSTQPEDENPVKTNLGVFRAIQDEPTRPKNEYPGQITMTKFNSISMTAQNQLWSELQKIAPEFDFVPAVLPYERNRLPTKLKDAKENGTAGKPLASQYWCSYCASFRTFRNHNSYDRCIACGISTMDFYVRSDNRLWHGELSGKGKNILKSLNKGVTKDEEDGEE